MTQKRIEIILDKSKAQRNAKELDQSLQGVGKSADTAAFAMNKLATAIAAAISVDVIVGYVDAWARVENQLKRTTTSSDDLLKVSAELLKVSNDTRASLDTTADLYTSLSISTKSLGVSQGDVLGVTKTINNLFLESGKRASETAGAVRQLGQALESGALRGDEFNSVAEGAPGILRAIEKETNLTRKELRELAEQGEITAELIVRSLKNYSDEAQKAADKTARTFEQSSIVARNNATAFIGSSQALGDAVRLAGDGLVAISENLDKLAFAAGAAAAIYVARLIPATVASGAAFVTGTIEAIKYQAALARMAGVSATAAAAQTALAGAARAASGAMAFLGGPLGVVFLAASALVYFTSQADSAKKATDALSISTEGLTKNQAAAAKLTISEAIDAQNEKLTKLNDNVQLYQGRLKAIRDLGGENSEAFAETNEKLIEAKGRYDDVSKSLNQLKDKWIELNNIQNGIKFLTPGAPVSSSASAPVQGGSSGVVTSPAAIVDDTGQREIASFKAGTQSLLNELNLRRQISDIYRQQALADDQSYYQQQLAALQAKQAEEFAVLDARAAEDRLRRDEQFRQALENEKIQEEERRIIRSEQDAQNLLAEQLLQEQRTAIYEQGKKAREDLDKAEWQARLANAGAFGNALLQLGQGQSKKIFKVGQTLALAQASASLPVAVLESFKNGGGFPWGLIPAGTMLATGLKNIQQIKNAGAGLGGGGGATPNISLPSGGGASSPSIPNTASTTELTQQRRIIDLRGVKADDKITVSALAALLEDDGAIVAIEGARQDAERRNVIGVTAR